MGTATNPLNAGGPPRYIVTITAGGGVLVILLRKIGAGVLLLLCISGGARGVEPSIQDPAPLRFDLTVVAEGLKQPDGLALHPVTHELYVSEESANRISVIRNGRAEPVLDRGFRVRDDLPEWAVSPDRPKSALLSGELHSPEGIGFDAAGRLYVLEDTPRGRVLEFAPDAAGKFKEAALVPVPWLGDPYAWESITLGRNGQIYLAGSAFEAGAGSSCVLARNGDREWWVVDIGSFASFSSLALAPEEDVLITGDEALGALTWWDTQRQRELDTVVRQLGGSIEGLCLLPDGSLAVAQENVAGEPGTPNHGRVVRVDPLSGEVTVLADRLGTVESVICDERTGALYVTEDSTGRVLCLTPRQPYGPRMRLLQVARRGGEARRGLPPRQAPDFLRKFMSRVGVDLVDQGATPASGPGDGAQQTLTLEELGACVPLVAGRVRIEPMPHVADPITELSFLNLFPNHVTAVDNQPAPSVCLFAARHRSGRVDRSQVLGGYRARKWRGDDASWDSLNPAALVMLPLATCSAVEDDNGVTIVMSFVGLDRTGDCFLTLNYGRRNEAFFATADERLEVARASFSQLRPDGTEAVDFAMTGIRPRRAEDATWLRIGTEPQWSLLSPWMDIWVSRWTMAQMPDLVRQMRQYNRHVLDSLLDEIDPERIMATRPRAAPHPAEAADADGEQEPVNRVQVPPPGAPSPMADAKPPAREQAKENILTNVLLGRIMDAWQRGSLD